MAGIGGFEVLNGKQILIVEDEFLAALQVEDVLTAYGCHIAGTAATVEAAIELIAAQHPDAVVLDLNLRGRSAEPVAAAMRDRNVPFVVLSAYDTGQGPALDAPRVRKPVDARDLLECLCRAMARPGRT